MDVVQIKDASRRIGAPIDWDPSIHGHCGVLPVIDDRINGINFMVSFWRPTKEEIEALQNGAVLQLHVAGAVHPVVAMAVSEAPEEL